jgi:hypothetical protein
VATTSKVVRTSSRESITGSLRPSSAIMSLAWWAGETGVCPRLEAWMLGLHRAVSGFLLVALMCQCLTPGLEMLGCGVRAHVRGEHSSHKQLYLCSFLLLATEQLWCSCADLSALG